jgi:hypothetical protein
VTLAHDPPEQRGVCLGGGADDEERRPGVVVTQDAEDLRRPARVGAVVEGQVGDRSRPGGRRCPAARVDPGAASGRDGRRGEREDGEERGEAQKRIGGFLSEWGPPG